MLSLTITTLFGHSPPGLLPKTVETEASHSADFWKENLSLWAQGRCDLSCGILMSPGSGDEAARCVFQLEAQRYFLVASNSAANVTWSKNELGLTCFLSLQLFSRLWPIRLLCCSWVWIHLDSWITPCQQSTPKWLMPTWNTCGRAPVRYRRAEGSRPFITQCWAVAYTLALHNPHRTKSRLKVLFLLSYKSLTNPFPCCYSGDKPVKFPLTTP